MAAQDSGRPANVPWVTGSHQSTLDTYVLDYLHRRGFRKAAAAFASDSGLPLESPVPFDAPQGLLFEWWEAFWLIFLASSGKVMNRNATVYVDAIKQRRHAQQFPPGAGPVPPPPQPGPPRIQSQAPPGYAVAGPSGHPGQPMPNGMAAPPTPQQANAYALRGRPPPAGHPAQPGPPQAPPAPAQYTPQAQYAAAQVQYQHMQEARQLHQSQQQQQVQQQQVQHPVARTQQQQAEAIARDNALRAHHFQQQQQYAQQQHQLAAQHAANQQGPIGPNGGHMPRPAEAQLSRAFIDQCIAACGFAGKSLNELSQEESQHLTAFIRQTQQREAQAQQRMAMLNQPGGYPPNVEPPYDYVAPSPGAYPPGYGSPAANQPGPGAPFATTRSARKLQQQQANGATPRANIVATPTNAPTPPTPDLAHMPAPSPRSRKRARVDAPTPGGGNNAPTPSGSGYERGGEAAQTPQQLAASPAPMHAPSPRNPTGENMAYGIVEAEALARVPQRHDSMLSQHSAAGSGSGPPNGYSTANGHLSADNASTDGPAVASPAAPRSPLAHDASLSLSQPAGDPDFNVEFDFDSLLDFS